MISGDIKVYTLADLSTPTTLADLAKKRGPHTVFTATDRITVGCLEAVVPCGHADVYNVTLDDSSVLKVTEDQGFLMLDGSTKTLNQLKSGDSLYPLYLSVDKGGYPNYREVSTYNIEAFTTIDSAKVRKVSRMVAESKLGDRLTPKTYVTHVDQNKQNCHPTNLTVTSKRDAKQRLTKSPLAQALKEAQQLIENNPKNHKVVKVSFGEKQAVYGCVMSETDNLAIGGVFLLSMKDE